MWTEANSVIELASLIVGGIGLGIMSMMLVESLMTKHYIIKSGRNGRLLARANARIWQTCIRFLSLVFLVLSICFYIYLPNAKASSPYIVQVVMLKCCITMGMLLIGVSGTHAWIERNRINDVDTRGQGPQT